MRNRRGFTLVELLVVMTLVLLIMVILANAFGQSLVALRKAKGIGDLQEKLRSATTIIRRDLAADHFDGKRRCSDFSGYAEWNRTPFQPYPREGLFRILGEAGGTFSEGTDSDGMPSYRVTQRGLHFTVKLRSNQRDRFFQAQVPAGSPLLDPKVSTFYGLPSDARMQDGGTTYSSQWAEIGYSMTQNGQFAGGTPLFALYRSQYLLVADNSGLMKSVPNDPATKAQYGEISYIDDKDNQGFLYFCTPTDTANRNYSFSTAGDAVTRGTLLLNDVISFEVAGWKRESWNNFEGIKGGDSSGGLLLDGIRVTIRIWDIKTQQARQVTVFQDL